ncbi:MAG: 4Fe-4S binding protein, partial [Anaerolineaceae bacterium]|nr:4Fe-4S binding protein [Anaerolineaceae bacterium]
ADAIAATNSIQALVGIDVETGRPLLPAFGGYSGPSVHPIMLRIVAQIAQAVKIPISGIGGVSNWKHAIEMMMVGASTVQIGTGIMWRGYKVIGDIISGMESFMVRKGYKSTKELVGVALKHITTTEEMAKLPPVVAILDEDLCVGCGNCVKVCGYDAIEMNEKNIAKMNIDNCDGCGLCVQVCPNSALSLVDKMKLVKK